MFHMPKISAATVVEHREQRRTQLLDAAAMLIVRDDTFTMAQVAAEVGLSRSAVYEYYSSAADLIADVLVDEHAEWASSLERVTLTVTDPVRDGSSIESSATLRSSAASGPMSSPCSTHRLLPCCTDGPPAGGRRHREVGLGSSCAPADPRTRVVAPIHSP